MDPESSHDEPAATPGPSEPAPPDPDGSIPWQQRLYQNVWLWAAAALLFWLVSYVVWGWVDLLLLPEG